MPCVSGGFAGVNFVVVGGRSVPDSPARYCWAAVAGSCLPAEGFCRVADGDRRAAHPMGRRESGRAAGDSRSCAGRASFVLFVGRASAAHLLRSVRGRALPAPARFERRWLRGHVLTFSLVRCPGCTRVPWVLLRWGLTPSHREVLRRESPPPGLLGWVLRSLNRPERVWPAD